VLKLEPTIPEKEKQESELILYGKLYSKPNVNFQAFCGMKKAWKVEIVKCEIIEQGLFCFLFESVEDKRRVLKMGPWSFTSNLLVLLEGDPNVPEHCY